MAKYVIEGNKKLEGTVRVSGSKNATLPILCASLLTKSKCEFTNVPDIADVHTMMQLLKKLGCKVEFNKNTLTIDSKNLKNSYLSKDLVGCMRASILLLGPLVSLFNRVKISYPGGCVLGKRPVDIHLDIFEALGCKVKSQGGDIIVEKNELKGDDIVLSEASVTATENAIMAAVLAPGKTEIHLAACEPHVQDLCRFLNKCGAKIQGIGSHDLTITGVKKLQGVKYKITGDYLEAGTFIIAAALTKGNVKVKGISPDHLYLFLQKLNEIGVKFKTGNDYIEILPGNTLHSSLTLKTAVHPGFPTDLQAPFSVLLTQARGVSKIFETLFEGRLNYLFELEKMGAKVEILNPHQAIVIGPTKLHGVPISSCDIRAGAAMVLAALVAKGKTEITNIQYIDRGYENLDQKLKKLGASIKRS